MRKKVECHLHKGGGLETGRQFESWFWSLSGIGFLEVFITFDTERTGCYVRLKPVYDIAMNSKPRSSGVIRLWSLVSKATERPRRQRLLLSHGIDEIIMDVQQGVSRLYITSSIILDMRRWKLDGNLRVGFSLYLEQKWRDNRFIPHNHKTKEVLITS